MTELLQRFVDAQASVYHQVTGQLAAGLKTSHWMWFIFPQLRGLGRSDLAHYYGIPDLNCAQCYIDHPLLGARLRQCCDLLLAHRGRSARAILGSPDDLKLCSCATLFAHTQCDYPGFEQLLNQYFAGQMDPLTVQRLRNPTQQSDSQAG